MIRLEGSAPVNSTSVLTNEALHGWLSVSEDPPDLRSIEQTKLMWLIKLPSLKYFVIATQMTKTGPDSL